jgi:hypothetical protein
MTVPSISMASNRRFLQVGIKLVSLEVMLQNGTSGLAPIVVIQRVMGATTHIWGQARRQENTAESQQTSTDKTRTKMADIRQRTDTLF